MSAMLDLLPLSPTWVLLGLCLLLYYLYVTWPFYTFKRLGIPGPSPVLFFGNILSYREGSHIFDCKCYKKYGKVYGFFEGREPMLMVGDLELIKEITVKQFNNFSNRRDLGSLLEAFAGGLFVLEDTDWKRVRGTISPTFSSSKLKQMTMLVESCADGLVSILMEKQEKGIMFDLKEVTSAYALDVISSTAFGVEADSLHNPDHPFAVHAKAIFNINILKGLFYVILPPPFNYVFKKGGFSLFPKFATEFFQRTVRKVIEMRQSNPDEAKRVDFLQLLLNAHNKSLDEKTGEGIAKEGKYSLSMTEVIGNSMLFWLAGYDTTANTIALTAYNLAFNQEAQDRVMEEVDTVVQNRGKLDYEAVNEMRYLDMCVNETLRIYPGAKRFDRFCKADTDVKGLHIPAGTIVNIPAYAIHHDPELWPEPEKFKPERFSKEAQESRDPYAFMPFGSGPRSCLGMRLAMLEIKLALARTLEKFRFVTCEKTESPLRLENNNGNQVTGGVWLKVEARTHVPRHRMSSA
ncbi:PREDICTED: cytochrome P450 3A8-like [Branchiostoma belcheri]|uniref:Cytochrome P450 3A8-like n=1 Tax=Branchiostoma belcheri TaxID=7741 RepID=A0A6P5APN0_BRABE|nr:PREDICTED: cytochrome P450 3A8-like [Branchiostoma belcheri]